MPVRRAKDMRMSNEGGVESIAKVNEKRTKERREGKAKHDITFRPDDELTEEEREEKKRKVAERSKKQQESKKQNRDMRTCLLMVLDAEVANPEQREKLRKALGLKNDDFIDNKLLVNFALFKQALKGDVSAIRQIQQMIGVENAIPVNQQVTINIEPYAPSSQPATLDFEEEEAWDE